MEFGWSEEQLALRREAAEFAKHQLNGFVEAGTEPSFSRAVWETCARFGVQGAFVPVDFGGSERDTLSTILLLEGIGYGCRDNGLTLALNGHMWAVLEPVLEFGTQQQHAKYLPGLCDGTLIGSHAMSELDAGSDAFSLSTTATRVDGGYILDGRKVYIGLAPVCDLALIFASTAPDRAQWGLSAFIVESNSSGFFAAAADTKMGLSGSPLGAIELRQCFVPEENRLGPEGAGASIFNHSMEWERSFIFTSNVGAMERQLDEAVAYAGERRQFGQPIGNFQSVSNRIADMKLRLETAKLLLYQCAWRKQNRERIPLDAALTKLHLSEAFVASSLDAVRLHGALGYLRDHGTERDLRDATGGVIYSGTSDIQRQLIAKLLGV